MPFTPLHFGPSAFLGLLFRKYLDIPVLVLANVIVDIEVLIWNKWPIHRYAHTLMIGMVVGAGWGLIAYRIKPLFARIMARLHLPYQTNRTKMIVSGILGVWLHAVIDAVYHQDVRLFWPASIKPLYNLISQNYVKVICIILLVAAFFLYRLAITPYIKNKTQKPQA